MRHLQLLCGASLLAIVSSSAANAATADATATGASQTSAAAVSEVIVTGTRQTGVTAANSPAPIEVVGPVALAHVGPPDLIETLQYLLPSFNGSNYGADTAALTVSAALRGLNPNDTLVLVDGKRRHPTSNLFVDGSPYQGSAAPDLSFIPVASVARVEVLTDGAAAQYGSDAIGGVVNIILKDSAQGGAISGTGGQYYEGDGATGAWSVNSGFNLTSRGFLNVTAEERYHGFSQQGGPDRRIQNPDGSLKPTDNPIDLAGVPGSLGFPDPNHIYGDTQSTTYNFTFNAGYDISDDVHAYAFGSYGNRTASAYENYRLPSRVTRTVGATTIVPFPHGFDPREAIKEQDFSITGGLKGVVSGWNWDLSTTYGGDHDSVSTLDSANASLFADTGFTPTNFYDGSFDATEWTSNLDINKDFQVGLASPLSVAFGGEVRRGTFGIGQGDAASTYKEGGQSYPGFQSTDAGTHSRTNYAGYVDLAADLVTNLKVDLAGRYEHYSDFGSTEVGKLTARYDFTPSIGIRGTVSTGFRAPTLAEEFYSATNVAPTFAVVQLPANSPAATLAGFKPLKPETSTNFSVGFVARPIEGMQVTLDAYEIDITNRIVSTATLLGINNGVVVSPGVLAAIAKHGNVLDPQVTYVGIEVFTNGANTRTDGVELTANYASDFGEMGHVDWTGSFNYNQTTLTKQNPLPAAVGPGVLLSPTAVTELTTATPREKAVLGAYYTHSKWSVNLREVIYGESHEVLSTDGTGNPGPDTVTASIPVTGITDLDIGYALTRWLNLDVGANDLFNTKPPSVPNVSCGAGCVRPGDGNNVYGEPDQFSPFGIDGGYYYVRATFHW
jgi:iron complex outermembrane receptor protein